MKNFSYSRADTVEGAVGLLSQQANSKFLGGGTNLVDLMRENIEQPDVLIDVTRLSPGKIISELPDGGLSIERRSGTARWRIMPSCGSVTRCSRRRFCSAHPDKFEIWRPPGAT